jgi:hypothetical protein
MAKPVNRKGDDAENNWQNRPNDLRILRSARSPQSDNNENSAKPKVECVKREKLNRDTQPPKEYRGIRKIGHGRVLQQLL